MSRLSEIGVDETKNPKELFKILGTIGKGSYGSVYKALFSETGDIVAVKQIVFEADDDLEDIVNEVRILKRCDSENIIKYYGSYIDKSDNSLWIAMELCEYGSISDLMAKAGRTLTEQECVFVLKGMLGGLAYLHSQNVLHRDIKGNNVLVGADGQVRLADFGVSAQATMSGRSTVIGTPYWMAPEVIRGVQYSTPADVWSCGITAIELMTGLPPLAELHPMRAMFIIPTSKPPTLTDKVRHSEALDDLIAAMLKKDPKQRETLKELLAMIDEYPLPIKGLETLLEDAEKRKEQKAAKEAAKTSSSTQSILGGDTMKMMEGSSEGDDNEDLFGDAAACMGTCIVNNNCTSVFNDTGYFTLSSSAVEAGSLASTIIRGTVVKPQAQDGTIIRRVTTEGESSEEGQADINDGAAAIKALKEPSGAALKEMDVPALQSVTKRLKKLLKCYKQELDRRNDAFATMSGLM